jgi:integrase
MSQPWKKQWPRIGTGRRRSYVVGFYDHERHERTRTFATAGGVGGASEWMSDYRAAERRGMDSLRRFLLDLDAQEANVQEGRMLGDVIELYFSLDADPTLDGGLAEQTFRGYRTSANCHLLGRPVRNHKRVVVGRHAYSVWVSKQPASNFNEPDTARELRERMRQAGQPQTKIKETWKVLSAILSWAAGSHDVPEVHTNGCLMANERTVNRRRSVRARGCGGAQRDKRKTGKVPSWALSPRAVEAIRYEMLHSSKCSELIAHRNATVVSLQYGYALRNQEVFALRFADIQEDVAEVMEVLTWGGLSEFGKTPKSTERRCDTPALAWADVQEWRALLRAHGFPARDQDFVIPGNLARQDYGVLDERTGAVHLSVNQAKKWGPKHFKPAVVKAAQREGLEAILGASPYALRRGGISARLRSVDAQTIKSQCGTSLRMLDKHYSFDIDDLRRYGPVPLNDVWSDAREEIAAETPPPAPPRTGDVEPPKLRLVA